MKMKIYCFVLVFIFSLTFGNIFPNENWESGFIDLGDGNDMFYIYFKARNSIKGDQTPLVLWLQGGPGCSSLIGLFWEHGPYLILRNGTYINNPYSWNNNMDIIYVDSPIGTGFSRLSDKKFQCSEENCVSRDLYTFLIKIYNLHPEFTKRPFYIFGESYGGHYVPSLSAYLIRANNHIFNFKGSGIGNGLTDAYHQFGIYPKFLYENGKISFFEYVTNEIYSVACVSDLKIKPFNVSMYCSNYRDYLQKKAHIINMYNIEINYTYDEQSKHVEKFINNPNTLKELGIFNRTWSECNHTIDASFKDDIFRSYKEDVEYILQKGLELIIYVGEFDYRDNWEANRNYLKFVEWDGKKEFNKQKYQPWIINEKESGLFMSCKNLMFLRIHEAGHMSPMDKPKELFYMINNFTHAV